MGAYAMEIANHQEGVEQRQVVPGGHIRAPETVLSS